MNKAVWLIALAAICLTLTAGNADARRYASMVVDARTGTILHADAPDRWVYPASLTKIMTLYMLFDALERGRLTMETPLPVSARAAAQPPSKFGLRVGQRIKVRDAIMGLVTKSANDVAVVVAEAISGSESRFAQQMTQRARDMGLRSTTFRNASGLPNAQQKTTARDMIRLAIAIQRDFPQYYGLFATQSFSYAGKRYRNHNRLLESYGGTDGIKTGYIRASGFNLAASVERDGRRLVAVVFGGKTSKSRNAHMAELLDQGFVDAARRGPAWAGKPTPRRPSSLASTTFATRAEPVASVSGAAPPKRRPPMIMAASSDESKPLRVSMIPAAGAAVPDQVPKLVFGVEVGAFRSAGEARRAADAVASIAPLVMAGAQIEVAQVSAGDTTLYRARRIGLTPDAAAAVCEAMIRLGQRCDVISRHEAS